jgi:hypothetical protein
MEPITLDLSGKIALRARAEGQGKVTEVVLGRSEVVGPPVQLVSNRSYLARSLELGFLEFQVVGASRPVVCRLKDRIYAWMPLAEGKALPPGEDVLRITSQEENAPTTKPRQGRRKATSPTPQANGSEVQPTVPNPSPKASERPTNGNGFGNLIEEAEGLKEALREVYQRTVRLVAVLKQQRKQSKLVASTLATLKQLQQMDG